MPQSVSADHAPSVFDTRWTSFSAGEKQVSLLEMFTPNAAAPQQGTAGI